MELQLVKSVPLSKHGIKKKRDDDNNDDDDKYD